MRQKENMTKTDLFWNSPSLPLHYREVESRAEKFSVDMEGLPILKWDKYSHWNSNGMCPPAPLPVALWLCP